MIYHACKDIHNFGDYIGPVIYRLITGKDYVFTKRDKPHYMVCGSILREANANSIVMGAGYNGEEQRFEEVPKEVVFVRGFNTQKQLAKQGIQTEVYGDPGLCLPLLYDKPVKVKYEYGFLPHYVDYDIIEVDYKDFLKIDPRQNVLTVVDQIRSCKMIVSSSLHGLIVANAYGIPAVWIEFSNKVEGKGYKFKDYYTLSDLRKYPSIFNVPKPINKMLYPVFTKREHFTADHWGYYSILLPDLQFANPKKMIEVFKEYWL